MQEEEELSIVVVGHVNHGKSTLIGRMLHETGIVGDGELDELEKEAREKGKKQSKFAFAMDQFEEEREKLVTIDTRSRSIRLDGRKIHFADAPGHRKWIRNVIMGSMFADAALLVVRADRGPEEQTREHTWISKRLFGIDQAVVAIEMMDLVDYSQEKFEERKQQVKDLLENVEHAPSQVRFVPTSGYRGENISGNDAMEWWDGPTLLDAVSSLERDEPERDAPARFLCLESFRDIGRDSVLASGLMLQGEMEKERIRFLPSDKKVDIDAIEEMGDEKQVIEPEDRVTIVIDDSDSETDDIFVDDIQRGYFAVKEGDELGPVEEFTSELYLCREDLEEGEEINVWVYGNNVSATVESIESPCDAVTDEESPGGSMEMGEIASVRFDLDDPVIIQPISETRSTSMFMVLDGERAIGYGNATEVKN